MKKEMTKQITERRHEKSTVCRERISPLGDAKYVPVGCRACGNPAYPNCKTSCPMFDD